MTGAVDDIQGYRHSMSLTKILVKVPITLSQFLSFSKVDVESKPKQAK